MLYSSDLITSRLRAYQADVSMATPGVPRASVIMIMAPGQTEVEVLMIERAQREGDPWSGQMAFPGGKRDPEDSSDLACGLREVDEELSLRLQEADVLSALSPANTGWRPDRPEMWVFPFIFMLSEQPAVVCNQEVASAVWVPVSVLLDLQRRERLHWDLEEGTYESEMIPFAGREIWGLSLRMINEFAVIISDGLIQPPQFPLLGESTSPGP
jgi:8-oxo-dGTP pyrophosphatase MutT (NUDIX family)